ncbi:hypothetical protein [Mesorhizobium sp. GbtcB19]|nr:hypothetical protein [Mesorhizobium sp. GbtcB19]
MISDTRRAQKKYRRQKTDAFRDIAVLQLAWRVSSGSELMV